MTSKRRTLSLGLVIAMLLALVSPFGQAATTQASGSGTLTGPQQSGTTEVTWTSATYTTTNYAGTTDLANCTDGVDCDEFMLTVDIPTNYWEGHEGGVTVEISWPSHNDDFDLYVFDSQGTEIGHSTGTHMETNSEKVELGKLAPGTYRVVADPFFAVGASFSGRASLRSLYVPPGMTLQEDKDTIMELLTVDYPVNVIFVGTHPTPQQVADLKAWLPTEYKPTVANKSPGGNEAQNTGSGLVNWTKNHLITNVPYFLGIKFNYQLRIIQASDEYARALFQVAEDSTARDQAYKASSRGQDMARYDSLYGHFRVLAKNGDASYRVTDPTKTDLIDAYAVEDWIFNSRLDQRWNCAFRNLETNECHNPSIIQPDPTAYHDPFYDRNGLNLDRMPQGLNKGSSFFFMDTFTPSYASEYFRPGAYHTYGTDRVVNGQIDQRPIEQGGSWRITDPDTGAWDGVDYARTWGGRYRFHYIDLGAAPNNFESLSWLGAERQMSSDYPLGDPPIWQYTAEPRWNQAPGTVSCTDTTPQNTANDNTFNTPCRLMPRIGRSVSYGLFFRSTAGYLYRPIPRADVNWLATSTWTDFYSRPQHVNGQLTNLPWYGTWWTNTDPLYKINQSGDNSDDVLRWLSSAVPYTRWVGRKGEVIPIYDPTNNQPTGRVLDTSPKYEDLPAPKYHVINDLTGIGVVPEPLYPGDGNDVIKQYGQSQVNLTEISNVMEKAKARGVVSGYDMSVNTYVVRDYIDGHKPGIADEVIGTNGLVEFPLVNTIPSVNMVFEKTWTWALPAIVGGKAEESAEGEAWGVFNNVNDRVKMAASHYGTANDPDGDGRPCEPAGPNQQVEPCSVSNQSLPSQNPGSGLSYTVEHEAAHNLGLSHPHDGAYGVDKCPNHNSYGARAGKWECYWTGLGYMYDISAAPTTYAMSYRPYEVEDQDNLQRGHVAEYLVGAQEALRTRLIALLEDGLTEPNAQWLSDYERMKVWRAQAAELFRRGDYLHAEYAARNASLAARGFPQTQANTVNPRLLEAGQVYYFSVNPQSDGTQQTRPDLIVSNLTASATRPGQTTLTAVVSNIGTAPASSVVVRFLDGQTLIANSNPVASIAAGSSTNVAITWNTRGLNGERVVAAVADPNNTVVELNEANNRGTRTITIRGNKVENGSFEQSTGQSPSGWSGTQSTSYDTSGANASDGTKSAKATGNGGPATLLNPAWTSAPIEVTVGKTYDLAMTVKTEGLSSAPSLKVTYLDGVGNVLNTVTGITTNVTGTSAAQLVMGQVTIPPGVTRLRVTLIGFSPTDLTTRGSVWFDDVWVWER
jgi:hypothetical protein